MSTVYTTCRYCESNCALEIQVTDNKVTKIMADKNNPQTWKDTCSKGLTAHELVEHPRRIKAPMKRVGDEYVEASYDEAIKSISRSLTGLIKAHGKDSVGYYHGNPLGFTSGLMFSLGFIDGVGTQNKYNVGSIDQNNNHVVSQAMFDHPYVPFSPDIDHCDYLLMVGMNPAESKFGWLGSCSNGWERSKVRQKKGMKLVVVDPLHTKTTAYANQHLQVTPGKDWALLLAMVKVIFVEHLYNQVALQRLPVEQVQQLETLCQNVDSQQLANVCGIPCESIEVIAREFSAASHAMCITQTGVSMCETGTLGHWLGLVLDIITGHLDQKGGRRYDGGYINMTEFAAKGYKGESTSRVRGAPTVMGNRSLCELPDEILTPGPGQVKAMIIHSGNPVTSGPNSKLLDKAFEQLDLLVAVDLVQRESHRHAHWLIPGVHWLERGELPFNLAGGMDDPHIQYSQQALQPPEGVRPEWEFFIDLALAMKVPMLGQPGVNTIIKLTRWIASLLGKPDWAFSPAMMEKLLLKVTKKVSWSELQANPHGLQYEEKQYGQLQNQMGERVIQLVPDKFYRELQHQIDLLGDQSEVDAHSRQAQEYPFYLMGKRSLNMLNSWLMELPNMQKREQQNFCEMHPEDAKRYGIADKDLVRIKSTVGEITITASISEKVTLGNLVVQHGWGSRIFAPAEKGAEAWQYGVNRNELVDNQIMDPFSGTPNLNSSRVSIERCA